MDKQLSELNIIELKAIAYDQLAQIEMAQSNLRAINQELNKRMQAVNQGQQQIPPFPAGSITQM